MARALSAGDLANLRKDGQGCKLYLSVLVPAVQFRCRVDGTPTSLDDLALFDYKSGDGDYGDTLAGMTVYVGTSQGAYDVGMARLRTAPTADSGTGANGFKVGEESELNIVDDHYVSVVDEFTPWPRHIKIASDGEVFADFNVEYVDQHSVCDPAVVMGPPGVVWLESGTTTIAFDASDTWSPTGSPSTYAWTATRCATAAAAGTWTGDTTATPTLTLATADLGTVRVACTVTMDDGASATGYRYVFVYNPEGSTPTMPTTQFVLNSCSGDWMTGGWSFKVALYDEALRSEIRDRTLIILHALDWYGDSQTSVGPIASNRRANIVAIGWVQGESISINPTTDAVTFTVQGPHWWLDHMSGFPVGVEDYAGTPSEWYEFENLTIDRGLWHFLHWASTMTAITDVTLTGDTREISVFDAPSGTLWQQLNNVAEQTILARLCADRYGRLYAEINSQFLTSGRGAITVVQDIETQDWREEVVISRQTIAPGGLLDLSGVAYASASGEPYFSLSPGHVFKHYGSAQRKERLALVDQATSNTLAGLILGCINNEYPHVTIPLASNHRAIDVCPHQYVTMSLASGGTERGIVWTTKKFIPRRVSFRHNPQTGTLFTDIEVEGYTTGELAVDGDPPADAPPPSLPPAPTLPPLPPEPPTVLDEPDIVFVSISGTYSSLWRTENWTASPPTWTEIKGTLNSVGGIRVDQINRKVYVMNSDGLFRGSVDSSAPAWTQVLDTASPPSGTDALKSGWTVTLDGYVCVMATEDDACGVCDAGGGAPAMVIVAPDASVSVLYSQFGCGRSTCCYFHGSRTTWWYSTQWSVSAAGSTARMTTGCRSNSVRKGHVCSANWGDAEYEMTNEGLAPGTAWTDGLVEMCDLDGLLIGSYDDPTLGKRLFSLVPGTPGVWTDITPTGWADPNAGFDRDATVATAFFTASTYVYKTSGGVAEVILDKDSLPGSPGSLRHVSCYCGDADQLFLVLRANGGTGGRVLTTRDGGSTWTDKTGALLAGALYYDIRAIWTEA